MPVIARTSSSKSSIVCPDRGWLLTLRDSKSLDSSFRMTLLISPYFLQRLHPECKSPGFAVKELNPLVLSITLGLRPFNTLFWSLKASTPSVISCKIWFSRDSEAIGGIWETANPALEIRRYWADLNLLIWRGFMLTRQLIWLVFYRWIGSLHSYEFFVIVIFVIDRSRRIDLFSVIDDHENTITKIISVILAS